MLPFYFILLGTYLYYARSKYFPAVIWRPFFPGSQWVGLASMLAGSLLFVRDSAWAGGLLLTLASASLAMIVIQLFAALGKRYFYGLLILVHCLTLLEFLSYAG